MSLNLNSKLKKIGFGITTNDDELKKIKSCFVDLEQTIIDTLLAIESDPRLISLLFSWIKVHGNYVIVEKLKKISLPYSPAKYPQIRWLSGIAAFAYEHCSTRWKKLIVKYQGPFYLYSPEITASAIQLKGKVEWLDKLGFILPSQSLRIREEDVLTPKELIKINHQYKNRYLYGASWRADIITAIELGLKNPTKISHLLSCSYEPAHRVFYEYKMATT